MRSFTKRLRNVQEDIRIGHEVHAASFIGAFFLSIIVLRHYERVVYKRATFWLALIVFLSLVYLLPSSSLQQLRSLADSYKYSPAHILSTQLHNRRSERD